MGTSSANSALLRVWRNLLCLSLSFLLMFTSYQGLASLQSSFNSIGGLGTAGLAVTYACVVPSSLLLSPIALGRLGSQRTMWISLLGYLAYMCLNLLPTWGTVIPASALLGLCGAPLWAALSLHIVRLAGEFDKAAAAAAANAPKGGSGGRRSTAPMFFGLFFTIVSSCNIWGNLISYLALYEPTSSAGGNSTQEPRIANFSCGYQFCSGGGGGGGGGDGGAQDRPSMTKFYIMMSCFIAAAVLSVLVMFFLVDRIDDEVRDAAGCGDIAKRVREALVHLVDTRQLLLAPLTITAGLSQSFSVGDFTEAFVACSSGIAAVGLVMVSFGASQVVTGVLVGQIAARVGQAPVLLSGLLLLLGLNVGSLFWEVLPEPQWPLHAMAAAFGAVDTVWVTLLNALYGDYFLENANAAFSALRFWQSLGFILGFSYNKLLCIEQKLQVMIALICVSCVTFSLAVLLNRRVKRVATLNVVGDKEAAS